MTRDKRARGGLAVVALWAVVGCSGDDEIAPALPDAAVAVDAADCALRSQCEPVPDCDAPLTCPAPTSTTLANVCGTVRRIDTSAAVDASEAGALSVAIVDALAFAASTPASRPVPLQVVDVDTCGRYRLIGVKPPATGFFAITLDDRAEADPDTHVLTAVAGPAVANSSLMLDAYAMTDAVDAAWTTAAGDPGGKGQTFATQGALLTIFRDATTRMPVAGVSVTATGGEVFTFADSEPLSRLVVTPDAIATGANGSALVIGPSTTLVGAAGPAGCTWSSGVGAPLAGVVFVHDRLGTCQ